MTITHDRAITDDDTPTTARQTTMSIPASVFAAIVLAGLSACGGGGDEAEAATVPPAAEDSVATSPSPVSTPETSTPDAATPAPTAPATTEAPPATDPTAVVEFTPELAAFAEANGELIEDWSTLLITFGDQAIDHLDDVSQAPAAAEAVELSDDLVAAIGSDSTDGGLVTLRDFATGISTAIGHAVDGDHEMALSLFLELQSQADALTAALDATGV